MLQSYFLKGKMEAGCDEAGRGCLAGPVVAAAVILPSKWRHDLLNDSKQLKEADRQLLRREIENKALDFQVAFIYQQEIDEINILNASIKAMHLALDGLTKRPRHIIIDGNRFHHYNKIPHTTIIKGDSKYASIAAASILAKTYRDDYMETLHSKFPVYGWNSNKGYPTPKHRNAIREFGPCEHHRMSFQLLPTEQLKLF